MIPTTHHQVQHAAVVPVVPPGPQAARLAELASCCGQDELGPVLAVLRRVTTPATYRLLRRDIDARRAAR